MTELDAVFPLWPLHAHKTVHILHTQGTDIPPQHKHQTQIQTDTYISMYTHIKFEKESEYIFLAATTEAFYVYMHTYMLQAYTHSNTHMYT